MSDSLYGQVNDFRKSMSYGVHLVFCQTKINNKIPV